MSVYKEITQILGRIDRDPNFICTPFHGDVFEYVEGDKVLSYCYLNIHDFFSNGMASIKTTADSIEKINNDVIYSQKIGRVAIKDFNFTLSEVETEEEGETVINKYFNSTSSISKALSGSFIVVDNYESLDMQLNGQQISIKDNDCSSVDAFMIKNATAYLYYILANPIQKKISPNPDYVIEHFEGTGISTQVVDGETIITSIGNIQLSNNIDYTIQLVTKKNVEYIYHDLKNHINDLSNNVVKSITTSGGLITPIDGNVTIEKVDIADFAENINTSDTMTQSAIFDFRTAGGDDDITTGLSQLVSIKGKTVYGVEEPSSVEIINLSEESEAVFEASITDANMEVWREWLLTNTLVTSLSDEYTVEYVDSNWTVKGTESRNKKLYDNPAVISGFNTIGVTVTLISGSYNAIKFTINYTDSYITSAKPTTITGVFSAVGYNLYNAATNLARVTGENRLRFVYPTDPTIKFYFCEKSDLSSPELIEFSSYTAHQHTTNFAYIPPTDGYIYAKKIENGQPVDLPTGIPEQIMINLVWSGKKLGDDTVVQYEKDEVNILKCHKSLPITLYEINGKSDELNLVNKQYISRVGVFPATRVSLDVFGACSYILTQQYMYVDFSTLSSSVYGRLIDLLNEHIIEQDDYDQYIAKLPSQNEYSRIIDLSVAQPQSSDWTQVTDDPDGRKWGQYVANDFGLELIDINTTLSKPLISIEYTVNLIDKLRNRVVAYTPQSPSTSEQAQAISNLGLITVECYVGTTIDYITATNTNNVQVSAERVHETDSTISIILPSLGTWTFSIMLNNTIINKTLVIDYYGNYSLRMVGGQYGFRRSLSIADPSYRIEYIEDAAGFTPVSFQDGVFNPGSWEGFINEIAVPVIIDDGNIATRQELNRDDQNYSGATEVIWRDGRDGFVEFRKYIYVKRYKDSMYEYVIFSDEPGEGFTSYAFVGPDGTIKNAFYWGMFEATKYTDSTTNTDKLTGIPTSAFSFPSTLTLLNYETLANNVQTSEDGRSHIHLSYKSGWDYICDLITLITKTDDAQSVFGPGIVSSPPKPFYTSTEELHTKLATGGFVKSNSYNDYVKIFWIYNFYGNGVEPMLGMIKKNITSSGSVANAKWYVKPCVTVASNSTITLPYGYLPTTTALATAYNMTAWNSLGYQDTGGTGPAAAGFIATELNGALGFVPLSTVTTESYICDYVANANASRTTYAIGYGAGATQTAYTNYNGPRRLYQTSYANAFPSNQCTPRITYV